MIELRKKGFTLIELIAVLVILAIIVVIATPLVLNIIEKVKVQAAKRSVDNYGRAVEIASASYMLEHLNFPESVEDLEVEYSGSKVECDESHIYEDGNFYLSKCKVNGTYVKDAKEVDGYYHYKYGKFYDEYKVGDQVTYKDIAFRVLKPSSDVDSSVTLIKEQPIEYTLLQQYALGIVYDMTKVGNTNSYGFMPYYSRAEGCNGSDNSTCDSTYTTSDVRKVVDLWVSDKLDYNDLVDDDNDGAFARLITKEEYNSINTSSVNWRKTCNGSCGYWTMTEASEINVWAVSYYNSRAESNLSSNSNSYIGAVRPVIVINKSAIK